MSKLVNQEVPENLLSSCWLYIFPLSGLTLQHYSGFCMKNIQIASLDFLLRVAKPSEYTSLFLDKGGKISLVFVVEQPVHSLGRDYRPQQLGNMGERE